MGGLVMGNSADVPAHVVAFNRPADGVFRVLGLDGENVGAGGEKPATDIPAEAATTPSDSPST